MVIPYFDPPGVWMLLVLFAVLFIVLRSKFGGYLAVEGGEVGFELLQFVLFAPQFGYDGFELGNILFIAAVCSSYWAI